MPWEEPLQQVLESVQGPVAKIVAVIIIIVTGLTLAFGETSRRLPQADPDRVRPVDRVRRIELLPQLLQLRRRSADRMSAGVYPDRAAHIDGFEVPIHGLARFSRSCSAARRAGSRSSTARSLPRSGSASSNGLPGCCCGLAGHSVAVFAARRDPDFASRPAPSPPAERLFAC